MKTHAQLIMEPSQSRLKIGSIGYIDGYCRGGDDRPCAAFVSNGIIELVPIYALKVINELKTT